MIEVLSGGIFSSIQDQGRFGYRNIGVPVSGAMDLLSANLANALLNNDKHCAVLESTIIGPVLKFQQATFIAITGAACSIKLNAKLLNNNAVIKVNSGDKLSIGRAIKGVCTYLAVAGGFQTEKILSSRSYYQGISKAAQIQAGDKLEITKNFNKIINRTTIKLATKQLDNKQIQVTKAPEFDLLDKATQQKLFANSYKISPQSNRMAYKLETSIKFQAQEIITSSVQPGTVQLTPAGELIVLMRDCQTTGGYARVLQLSESAINQLAQIQFGTTINFKMLA